MKYSKNASRFLELSKIKNPTSAEIKERNRLRSELAAIGLDPRHQDGLEYRALVYDNRRLIEVFLDLSDKKKDTNGLGWQLRGFGIDISKKDKLRHILAGFKTSAKDNDKKKAIKRVSMTKPTFDDIEAAQVVEGEDDEDNEDAEYGDIPTGYAIAGT